MENETKYCPKCGNVLTLDENCSNCGWRGTSSPVEHPPTNKNSFLVEAMSKAESFRDFKILISIIGIIVGGAIALAISIGFGVLIILMSLFFLFNSITSYQHMNFQYFLAKSFLEASKDNNESINETIKTFFEDSDSK